MLAVQLSVWSLCFPAVTSGPWLSSNPFELCFGWQLQYWHVKLDLLILHALVSSRWNFRCISNNAQARSFVCVIVCSRLPWRVNHQTWTRKLQLTILNEQTQTSKLEPTNSRGSCGHSTSFRREPYDVSWKPTGARSKKPTLLFGEFWHVSVCVWV